MGLLMNNFIALQFWLMLLWIDFFNFLVDFFFSFVKLRNNDVLSLGD